jgi:hypothetical protein
LKLIAIKLERVIESIGVWIVPTGFGRFGHSRNHIDNEWSARHIPKRVVNDLTGTTMLIPEVEKEFIDMRSCAANTIKLKTVVISIADPSILR